MIDIDNFKLINDTYGHSVGDNVLKEVARTIQENCRDQDRLYRYGGKDIRREIKSMGFRMVIDDFGSGYSSMFQMRHLVGFVDLIKVDGAFIRRIDRDKYNRAIVESIKTLAEDFSIELVAEFIETPEELETVRSIGIKFGQGYIFGKDNLTIG